MKRIITLACASLLLATSVSAEPFHMPRAKSADHLPDGFSALPQAASKANPVALPASSPAMRAATVPEGVYIPEIHGNVLWPTNSPAYLTMAQLPCTVNDYLLPLSPSGLCANGGGVLINGIYYAVGALEYEGFESYWLYSFDGNTWDQLSGNPTTVGLSATDLALDPTDGTVYGCFSNDDGTGCLFGTIDFVNEIRTPICPLEHIWYGMGIDGTGTLYVIDYLGDLYTVNKQTGEMTLIGSTGLNSYFLTSAAIDPHSGRMFYVHAPSNGQCFLYEIDTDTAQPTLLYRMPKDEEIVGMYIAAAKTDYRAPAAPTNLTLTFTGSNLQGQVAFTAPSTTYEGTPGTGVITYTVTANGEAIATGNTTYGAMVLDNVTLPADGLYTVAVTVANDKGTSPEASATKYIGHDTPMAPVVHASNNAGDITVSWEAVTKGVHNGYIDPAAIRYTVTRSNDGGIVAQDIDALSTADLLTSDRLLLVKYSVTASANGHTSAPGVSNEMNIGPYEAPYAFDFQDTDHFSQYTIIDANNDGNKWYQFFGLNNDACARIRYNMTKAMDDWLITPAIRLEGGKVYVIHFDASKYGDNPNVIERIEVKYGQGNTAEAMTFVAHKPVNLTDEKFTTFTGALRPEVSGIYHVGFHGISAKDQFWLHLDNIVIEAGAIVDAPAAVGNFEVTAGSYGRLQADIAFNTPAFTFGGDPIESLLSADIYRDGVKIHTVDAPEPGQLIFYTDTEVSHGHHTYTATATNDAGEGKASEITLFIGTKTPAAPKGINVTETSTRGEVKVTWSAPDRDIEGNLINAANLTYHLYRINNGALEAVVENHPSTSHTHQAVDADAHLHVQYIVTAVSDGGISEPVISSPVPAGNPYTLPYIESFARGSANSIFTYVTEAGKGRWGTMKDFSIMGVNSSDDDNGYIAFIGENPDDSASLISGKVSLDGALTPQLSVKVFAMDGGEPNDNPIALYVNDGAGYTPAITTTIQETGEPNQWHQLTADLSAYKGKEIWVKLHATTATYSRALFDDLRVVDTSAAIEAVDADTFGDTFGDTSLSIPAEYYNLQGQRIATPTLPGLYLRRQGTRTTKVLVK